MADETHARAHVDLEWAMPDGILECVSSNIVLLPAVEASAGGAEP